MIIGVMCAYQEAAVVGDGLASLRAAGCERLVVVDGAWRHFAWYGDEPGSTDGTVEIARSWGAQVIEPPADGWSDEVTARNGYLVGEPGDWYLVLDADERATGVLPTVLDAPEGVYQLWVRTPGIAPVRRMRLVQEDGSLRYQYAHWAMYRQGRLLDQGALSDAVAIEHVGRPGDTDRAMRKAAWYARSSAQEMAYLAAGRAPAWAVEVSDMERIAYRYIGGGAWVPGLPARDLLESEAVVLAEQLGANLASGCPIYEAADEAVKIGTPREGRRKLAQAEQAGGAAAGDDDKAGNDDKHEESV